MADFVEDYNHTHHHSGIGLKTPAEVHYGLAAEKMLERAATLAAARVINPERLNTDQTPKILALPENAWINRPAERTTNELATSTPNGPIRLDKVRPESQRMSKSPVFSIL